MSKYKQDMTPFSTGYCTNVHAGATLDVTRANLEQHAVAVKQRYSPDRPMGVGLWLSAKAAEELVRSGGEGEFAEWLAVRGLVPYTLNGFPYGDFHQQVVKQLIQIVRMLVKGNYVLNLDFLCDVKRYLIGIK